MTDTTFFVEGTPAPQGSKRHVGNGRLIEASKLVKPWRDAITATANANNITQHHNDDTHIIITFYLRRPKSHYTSKGDIKHNAPQHHTTRPDLDKLVRSTLDGLVQANVLPDDSIITRIKAFKKYADPQPTGAIITITNGDTP